MNEHLDAETILRQWEAKLSWPDYLRYRLNTWVLIPLKRKVLCPLLGGHRFRKYGNFENNLALCERCWKLHE